MNTPSHTVLAARWFILRAQPFLLTLLLAGPAAAEAVTTSTVGVYTVQAGDLLEVSIWKEPDLSREVLVRPDGGLSFPLVGEIEAAGKSVDSVRAAIAERLAQYIPDPVVTVSTKEILGNKIYVVGEVKQPGEYIATRPLDVMQALSMAGGMTEFAARNDIIILRRNANSNKQTALDFRYKEVASGDNLEQNVILQAGDIVVVP